MMHKLLDSVEQHLASPATSLNNGDDWGLVQKVGTQPSPSPSLLFALMPSCPTMSSFTGG
jgi:hypothetical protein